MSNAEVYRQELAVAEFQRKTAGLNLRLLESVPSEPLLSACWPTGARFVSHPTLPHFFLNLLPEGSRLQLLMDTARAKDDLLELLLRVGWDTIGDIATLPTGTSRPPYESVYEAEIPDIRFWDLYFQSARGSTTNDQSIEPAIPGMQEKISASTITFGVRFRGYPSGILKLNPRAYPKLVENEAFWLAVARDAEIEVSESRVVRDRDGESGLLVERFDRLRTKLGILKRHQEDGCQLLDLPPAQKYTPSFNAVLKAILNVVDSPRTDALRALQLYMFSYAVGNADLHAKNLSVIWADATRLSPAYDLLSTLPYDLSTNMALTLDGKNDQFKWIHFRRFAHRFGVSDRAFTRAAQSIDRAVRGAMDRVDIIGFPSATTDRMRAAIFDRLRRLGGIAAEGGGDSVA